MSWMDSWSRPGKHAAVPPPLYLTQGDDQLYCRSCGRIISSRKSHQKQAQGVKYCSDRCRHQKPGRKDREIEATIVALLDGEPDSGVEKTAYKSRRVKGDSRNIVTCDEIEEIVFGSRYDPTKTFGRRKNRASRALDSGAEADDVITTSGGQNVDDRHGGDCSHSDSNENAVAASSSTPNHKIRPPQTESEVNGSVGGEKGWAERQDETSEQLNKRLAGQQRAKEREMVRRAARRGVVFGFLDQRVDAMPHQDPAPDEGGQNAPARRKCEAVMKGSIVEPSYAKGDWGLRWREG